MQIQKNGYIQDGFNKWEPRPLLWFNGSAAVATGIDDVDDDDDAIDDCNDGWKNCWLLIVLILSLKLKILVFVVIGWNEKAFWNDDDDDNDDCSFDNNRLSCWMLSSSTISLSSFSIMS